MGVPADPDPTHGPLNSQMDGQMDSQTGEPRPFPGDELSRFILAQSAEGVAVPVLLFGAPEAAPSAVDEHDPAVRALADRLGLDLGGLELHSSEAYLLQCGLGQELLDDRLRARRPEVVR